MSATEMLARMREQKAKAQGPDFVVNPEDFYVKLRIVTHRRRQLALYLAVAFVVLTSLVIGHLAGSRHWGFVALPITFVGLLITLIPPSEEWAYRPWQARPRQYERHQIERR